MFGTELEPAMELELTMMELVNIGGRIFTAPGVANRICENASPESNTAALPTPMVFVSFMVDSTKDYQLRSKPAVKVRKPVGQAFGLAY